LGFLGWGPQLGIAIGRIARRSAVALVKSHTYMTYLICICRREKRDRKREKERVEMNSLSAETLCASIVEFYFLYNLLYLTLSVTHPRII